MLPNMLQNMLPNMLQNMLKIMPRNMPKNMPKLMPENHDIKHGKNHAENHARDLPSKIPQGTVSRNLFQSLRSPWQIPFQRQVRTETPKHKGKRRVPKAVPGATLFKSFFSFPFKMLRGPGGPDPRSLQSPGGAPVVHFSRASSSMSPPPPRGWRLDFPFLFPETAHQALWAPKSLMLFLVPLVQPRSRLSQVRLPSPFRPSPGREDVKPDVRHKDLFQSQEHIPEMNLEVDYPGD